jgi:hypothetical protein
MKKFLKSKLIFGFVVVAMLFGAAGVLGFPSSARASTTITVRGAVSCANHQFVNIWINSTGGGSGFYWFQDNAPDNRGGIFYATVPTTFPTTISLHVGCGGSTWNWQSDNWTPGYTLNSPGDNPAAWTASCNEGSMVPHTAQRCSWGGSAADRYAAWFGWIHLNGNGNQYVGLCLTFAFDAYRSNNIAIDTYWNRPSLNRDAYPEDVWPNITRGFVGTSQPPPYGALVFFLVPTKSTTSYLYSHVGISNGDGTFFSTDDTYGEKVLHTTNIHVETIAEHNYYSYGQYVGWWLPA